MNQETEARDVWKQYARLFKLHLTRLTAAGVPRDEAKVQASALARAEIERASQERRSA